MGKNGWVSQNYGYFFWGGVPIIRIVEFRVYIRAPLFSEATKLTKNYLDKAVFDIMHWVSRPKLVDPTLAGLAVDKGLRGWSSSLVQPLLVVGVS